MLRPYQEKTVNRIRESWNRGKRPLVVMPTGAGKTHTGIAAIRGKRTLWVAHRTELVTQTARAMGQHGLSTCEIIGGQPYVDNNADVIVGTVQSLLGKTGIAERDVIVLDEAHHYPDGNEWNLITATMPRAKLLGLTATPERQDGKPMGDVFDEMIVGARNSELFEAGLLVRPHVYRAPERLGNDLSVDPVDAVSAYCRGLPTFMFVPRVAIADQYRERLRARGIRAGVVSYEQGPKERKAMLGDFRSGLLQVLLTVDALTEGVDVPAASACVLARNFGHPSGMIQAVGRVLRPDPGKMRAVVVDLTGVTHAHGLPDTDWEYSLEGRAIRPADSPDDLGEQDPWDSDVTRSSGPFMQDVVGSQLVPVGDAPAVQWPPVYESPIDKARLVWDQILSEQLKQGRSRRFAAGEYRRQYGDYPPGYRV